MNKKSYLAGLLNIEEMVKELSMHLHDNEEWQYAMFSIMKSVIHAGFVLEELS